MNKRSDHKCSALVLESCRGCSLGKPAGSSCVLFLREQVRDLRVQEFLRELVVGVVASSDLAGSIIAESFVMVKAGT